MEIVFGHERLIGCSSQDMGWDAASWNQKSNLTATPGCAVSVNSSEGV
jgi:hypothetical protein